MTLPTEFLVYVAELLERLGVPYHVGGSVASSAHGMYRASADIDFVIDPTGDQLEVGEPAGRGLCEACATASRGRMGDRKVHGGKPTHARSRTALTPVS